MAPTPQVRSSAYLPFVHFLEMIGANVEHELEKELVPAIAHRDPEALVPIHLAHSFLERSARAAGLEDFGFATDRQAKIANLGAFGRSLLRSLTLNDALGKIHSTFALYTSAERIWWSRTGRVFRSSTTTRARRDRAADTLSNARFSC